MRLSGGKPQMRFGPVVLTCWIVGCGPPQAVDRVATDRAGTGGTGGSGRMDARTGSGGAGTPVAGTGGSTGGADGVGGAAGLGGSSAPDAGPSIDNPGNSGGTGGGAGPADAAMEPTPPPVDMAAPPDMAPPTPPPPDAPTTPPPPACPMPAADELIASFKGTLTTDRVGDRGGTTWAVLTGTVDMGLIGTVALATGPVRCGNAEFLRFTGTSNDMRAPIIRATFRPSSGSTLQFENVSAFKGVRMFVRSATGGRVRLKVPDRNTASQAGVCTLCSDHFALELDVTSDWQLLSFPFAQMKQLGTGDPQPALAVTTVWALEIVGPKAAQGTAPFTLDVDDISFFR
jgi:hypothetical protein